jgi:hypothetical protein
MKLDRSTLGNIGGSKLTTGMGIAMIFVIVLRLCGIKPEDFFGIDTGDIILYVGSVIAALLLLISKDPKAP